MKLRVRWHDGYLETFTEVVDWRMGSDTLWILHVGGRSEYIPLRSVRHVDFWAEAGE